nr:hypothetical protein [uncultured Dongia sp.]
MKLSHLFSFGHLNASPAPRAEEEEKDKDEGAEGTKGKDGENEEDKDKAKSGEGDEDEGDGGDAANDEEEKEANAAAKASFRRGVAAERKRIGQILASTEAGTNPSLAAHLACNTGLSLSAVVTSLKVSPAGKGGGLAAAMAANPAPKVGTDGGKSPGAQVEADWDKALAKVGVTKR